MVKEFKGYIWLNPVVKSCYKSEDISKYLEHYKFIEVFPEENHIAKVKKRYLELSHTDRHILDSRCPLIVENFNFKNFKVADADPILISTAKELSKRDDLKDKTKYIITPCSSLSRLGSSLKLKNTIFMTFDEFRDKYPYKLKTNIPPHTPVPFGFFKDLNLKTISIHSDSKTNESDLKDVRIIEGLYCNGSCHNGDGVKCIKEDYSEY